MSGEKEAFVNCKAINNRIGFNAPIKASQPVCLSSLHLSCCLTYANGSSSTNPNKKRSAKSENGPSEASANLAVVGEDAPSVATITSKIRSNCGDGACLFFCSMRGYYTHTMAQSRNSNITAVFLVLEKDDHIFLLRRHNTGYRDGDLTLIAGHVEAGETYTQAAIREAKEEAGIVIHPDHLDLCHVQHRKSVEDSSERVDLYFFVEDWQGEPTNAEPHKASEANWFHYDQVEQQGIIEFIHQVLKDVKSGKRYSEFGWDQQASTK